MYKLLHKPFFIRMARRIQQLEGKNGRERKCALNPGLAQPNLVSQLEHVFGNQPAFDIITKFLQLRSLLRITTSYEIRHNSICACACSEYRIYRSRLWHALFCNRTTPEATEI